MNDFDLKNYSLEHKNNLNKTENSVKKSCRVEYISLECIGLEHNNALFMTLYKTPERRVWQSCFCTASVTQTRPSPLMWPLQRVFGIFRERPLVLFLCF